MKLTHTTPETDAISPYRYPVVRREISSTANTNTGEAKPSLVSAICSKIHSSAAHSKITPVISKSRQEKENQVDNLNFVFLVCTCKGPPTDKTVLYSLLKGKL